MSGPISSKMAESFSFYKYLILGVVSKQARQDSDKNTSKFGLDEFGQHWMKVVTYFYMVTTLESVITVKVYNAYNGTKQYMGVFRSEYSEGSDR
jgi:hypothetical protein